MIRSEMVPTAPRREGFTLLEICLALAIGLMLILLAVPSISGLLAEQRLEKSSDDLQRLVGRARFMSVREQQAYALIWERDSIRLAALEKTGVAESDSTSLDRLAFAEGETYKLKRPAAFEKDPAPVWTFWPSGLCEPALVTYEGSAGQWEARYDALTARGVFLSSEVH